jgi:hypothetical protein
MRPWTDVFEVSSTADFKIVLVAKDRRVVVAALVLQAATVRDRDANEAMIQNCAKIRIKRRLLLVFEKNKESINDVCVVSGLIYN